MTESLLLASMAKKNDEQQVNQEFNFEVSFEGIWTLTLMFGVLLFCYSNYLLRALCTFEKSHQHG